MQANRIDVHHHLIPPVFRQALEAKGIAEVAGTKLPDWSPETSLDTMDRCEIRTALLSLSAPGVYFGDVQEARDLARACNECAAEAAARHPGRFGAFAVLPMPFTDHACAEAIYALDTLGADGIVLLGSTDGVFLGDPRLDELMAELDRRAAIVFVHPNLHPTTDQIGLATPHFMVEFLCDTTRAAVNLILTGTLDRFPNIRWILAHAGGFLPFIAWRIALADTLPHLKEKVPLGTLTYIRRFYYDTALSPSPFALAALKELVDPGQILFGSDFPFASGRLVTREVRSLAALTTFDATAMQGIDRGNALRLFPKFNT